MIMILPDLRACVKTNIWGGVRFKGFLLVSEVERVGFLFYFVL